MFLDGADQLDAGQGVDAQVGQVVVGGELISAGAGETGEGLEDPDLGLAVGRRFR